MTRKILAFLLVMSLGVSFVGVSLAAFDYSVFEQNELFTVELDPMDDNGYIRFASDDDLPMSPDEAGVRIGMDVLMVPDFPALIRLQFAVETPFINATEVILLPDKIRYTINALSEINGDFEGITICFTTATFPLIEEIIDKNITSLKYRLVGDNSKDGNMAVNVEMLEILYETYKSAGGVKQSFDIIETLWPVAIK